MGHGLRKVHPQRPFARTPSDHALGTGRCAPGTAALTILRKQAAAAESRMLFFVGFHARCGELNRRARRARSCIRNLKSRPRSAGFTAHRKAGHGGIPKRYGGKAGPRSNRYVPADPQPDEPRPAAAGRRSRNGFEPGSLPGGDHPAPGCAGSGPGHDRGSTCWRSGRPGGARRCRHHPGSSGRGPLHRRSRGRRPEWSRTWLLRPGCGSPFHHGGRRLICRKAAALGTIGARQGRPARIAVAARIAMTARAVWNPGPQRPPGNCREQQIGGCRSDPAAANSSREDSAVTAPGRADLRRPRCRRRGSRR